MSNTADPSSGGPRQDPSGATHSATAEKTREAAQTAGEVAQKAGQEAKRFAGWLWPKVKPGVDWTWLNLRVWVPFLATPGFRARHVSYGSRENRDGTKWNVTLPSQCWQCGNKATLRSRQYELETRSFEAPVGIMACTFGLAIFVFLLAIWLYTALLLVAAAICLGGVALAYIKSWPERAHIAQSTCPDHADTMRPPQIVVYENELHLLLATPELAEAAQAELAARRRAGGQHGQPDSDATVDPMVRSQPPVEASPQPGYKRAELPPIKLDD